MSNGRHRQPIQNMSPACLQTWICLQNGPGDIGKGQNGTHRRRNPGLEAKGRAVHGERWPGTFAGRTAERQDVLALSVLLGWQIRQGESRPLSRSDPESGTGEARRAGRASGRGQISRRGSEAKACGTEQQSHRQRVWGAVLHRASGKELERSEEYSALSG